MSKRKIYDIVPPKKFIKKEVRKIKIPASFLFWRFLIFAFLFLALFGIVGFFTLASVEIEIWPETETLDFNEKVVADTQTLALNTVDMTIPARIFEVEESASQEFPASGTIEKKAEGTIRVYNNYHVLVNLRSGTRFQPPLDEVIYFCSLDKIVIPAKSYVDVKVQACRPGEGEKYNIGPSKFSVPGLTGTDLFFYVHGESFDPMQGGGIIPEVTQDDLERGENILTEQVISRLENSFNNAFQVEALRLGRELSDFILLEESIEKEVVEIISEVDIGTETSSFNLRVKMKGKALVFQKSDLEEFARQFILSHISPEQKLQEESLNLDFNTEDIDIESGKITINLEFSSIVFADVEAFALKEDLRGKPLKESEDILENQTEIIKAQISAWPFWLQNIPNNIEKIDFKINLD
jgi:hypothetical protein